MHLDELERALTDLSEQLTAPRPGECLDCYLQRMLDAHGCAGHRFTRRWARDRPRGSADGLVRWAAQRGGCCCDCEVVLNSLRRTRSASRRAGVLCSAAVARREEDERRWLDGTYEHRGLDTEPQAAPGCSGVR